MPCKSEWDTAALVAADKRHVWHPFADTGEWCAPDHKPLVLVRGEGALLWDSEGREYIDGNSSIWTNIHGHNHPHINAAIVRQLGLVAHTSFLGFTNPPAIRLAEAIVALFPPETLTRVFFSDDGSTGIEAALRIVEQFWRLRGSTRTEIVAFRDGYHGDTAGAAALGARSLFGIKGEGWRAPVREVGNIKDLAALPGAEVAQIAAVVIEPLIQGAAGMKLWAPGTLRVLRDWTEGKGILLIADEVMTGFGRTGTMFACEQERVVPDIMILGKALTGGYLPLALTLITERVFRLFAAAQGGDGTLFYGHSYTGNALGSSAALASLQLFAGGDLLIELRRKIILLKELLADLEPLPGVKDIRQCGFIAAIELAGTEAATRAKAVCLEARRGGLLTRPIRESIVLMPPFAVTTGQLRQSIAALKAAIQHVLQKAESVSP